MRAVSAAHGCKGLTRAGAALRRRAAREEGFSLTEMLVVLVILGVVLGGLTTLFVSASTAQLDMSNRFQAQEHARVALDRLRREIHCASDVKNMSGATLAAGSHAGITVTLGSYCVTGSGDVTWCTRASSTPNAWALYRITPASPTCTGGTLWADYLVKPSGQVFSYAVPAAGHLTAIGVDLPVDLKPADLAQRYTLRDDIVLRNATRS
jgi:prepilin-type N-terminal cleavage/methylation domain-containing protein